MSQPSVSVTSGDISRIKSDAIITAINSGGMWYGGIDGVIQRNAGNFFHQQAASAFPLTHGQTVVAKGNIKNPAIYGNVVFVIDDLQGKLSDIIFNGLLAASSSGFVEVTVPTIRMGVMLGVVEKTPAEAVNEMIDGVRRFIAQHGSKTSIKKITFVVYNGQHIQDLLEMEIKGL
jgi:O-acetyl-ADP-ribose deacetylase (regulator of RNase III)